MLDLTGDRLWIRLLVLEYEQLKEEQRQRIGNRDHLVYGTLGSLAVVGIAALQAASVALLLPLGPICLVLGWTFLMNDQKVTAIGRHISATLVPQLARLSPAESEVFAWERVHRTDRHVAGRRIGQLLVNLLTFCLPGILAPLAYAVGDGGSGLLLAVAALESVGAALFTYHLFLYSGLRATPVPGRQ